MASSLMGRANESKHSSAQLLVSRSPHLATLPRFIYPSEVALAPASLLAPLGHFARHHTQVSSAAHRRPGSERGQASVSTVRREGTGDNEHCPKHSVCNAFPHSSQNTNLS